MSRSCRADYHEILHGIENEVYRILCTVWLSMEVVNSFACLFVCENKMIDSKFGSNTMLSLYLLT